MSRRGENIHKRKDGRWEARFPKGRDQNGKIIYCSVYGKTYREAKEKAALKLSENQKIPSVLSTENSCFGDILELWMEHNRVYWKGATVKKYRYMADRHILPVLGKCALSQLNIASLNSFLTKKLMDGRLDHGGGLSASYTRTMTQIINSVLQFAAEEELCPPVKTKLYKPIIHKKDIHILSVTEQKELENNLFSDIDPTRTGILLALHTGLRIGEICALSWKDIDLKSNIIHVRHTLARITDATDLGKGMSKWCIDAPKTPSSMRAIPISLSISQYLKRAKEKSKSEYAVSKSKNYVNPRTFEYRYHKFLRECGVASIHFHALRHTFATRCIEAGVDIKSLSEILGHSNVSTTLNTYIHSSIEMKRLQLEKLSRLSA